MLAACCFTVAAESKQYTTFAESPTLRNQKADEARLHAREQKEQAQRWAARRGLQMRHDDGLKMVEIMAVRGNRPLIYSSFNDQAAISTTANLVRDTSPFSVDGSGMQVGIWDGGSVMTNHQEFGNRVVAIDEGVANYHATHVAGTIGASGVVARAKGMAPNIAIKSYDWNYDGFEMLSASAAAPGQPDKLYLSNHSYGILAGWFYLSWLNPWTRASGYHWWGDITTDVADPYFGLYGEGPRAWDETVYLSPYFLPFKAAGNERNDIPSAGSTVYYTPDGGETWTNAVYDPAIHPLGDGVYKNGYDTIPYYGTAKNILTVGAVTDAVVGGMHAPEVATATTFTSWGPTDDGRIKPDIVANGDSLYSCNTVGTASYAVRSGTSMSSPNACGSAALLVDLYNDLFPGQAMRASTLKGLIIHTADDLGRPGPDYQYGWGLMNTRRAAELLRNHHQGKSIALLEDRVSEGGSRTATYVAYADGGSPLRATLCWTDPPGVARVEHDNRMPVLVHDLDLRITGPNGTEYYPFSLNYADPDAVATSYHKNHVDNVEQVLIHDPQPGIYTITIDVSGSLQDGEQWFSLITSGVDADEDGDGLPDSWEYTYFLDPTGGVVSADFDGDGIDNWDEYVAGTDPTDPASVFRIAAVETPRVSTNDTPFVIHWDSIPGRIYNVSWTYHLVYLPFADVSGDLRWPVNSFTDSVDRVGNAGLYKLEVRMDD